MDSPSAGYIPPSQGAHPQQQTSTAAPQYPAYPGYPYPGYGYPPPYYPTQQAPHPKRDTYRLVISIISIIFLSLTIIAGLGLDLISLITIASGTNTTGISATPLLTLIGGTASLGGGAGLYFAIRAVQGRPSAIIRLPSFLLPLTLTVIVLTFATWQFTQQQAQGSGTFQTPLILLSGILPAVTIFTLTVQRLHVATTWRRVWMSFLSGMFLATLIAIILEFVADVVLRAALQTNSISVQNLNSNSSGTNILFMGIMLSIVAPLAEEGFKPTGPMTIIGRIGSAGEAFTLGMAAGIGFDIFETTSYIIQGQADWVIVAVERVGAGFLHGVGAGMAMLGWYYIFRGRGIPHRFIKGLGALLYAVFQHGIFNGANLLVLIPGPIGNALNSPVWFFGLPETGSIYLFVVLYTLIIGVLLTVTHTIREKSLHSAPQQPTDALQQQSAYFQSKGGR